MFFVDFHGQTWSVQHPSHEALLLVEEDLALGPSTTEPQPGGAAALGGLRRGGLQPAEGLRGHGMGRNLSASWGRWSRCGGAMDFMRSG